MKRFLIALVISLLFPTMATAKFVAVLETSADSATKQLLNDSDRRYITNVLREQAVKELPAALNFTIMTRENIIGILPPGKSIEDCEGICITETGRNIAADYVAQARIESVGGTLALSAEMYETLSNKLISSFNGRGSTFDELLTIVKEHAPEFFKAVKASASYTGAGFGDFVSADAYGYQATQQYIVEIVTDPAGAIPSIDGKAYSKCISTPCKVQVSAGNHLFVVTKERYEDAELNVDVQQNNQRIELNLSPNFGFLELKTQLPGNYGAISDLKTTIDGKVPTHNKVLLDPGIHKIHVEHPCYDALDFSAGIEKQKTLVFDKPLVRGVAALELTTEWNGEPQSVYVYVDGEIVGTTPFSGQIPLCSKVTVGDADWLENVSVDLKWHEVSNVTHNLANKPEAVKAAEMDSLEKIRIRAEEAYSVLGPDESYLPESFKVKAKAKPKEEHEIHWIPLGISSATFLTGVIVAVVGNMDAKDASHRNMKTEEDYNRILDDIDKAQRNRTIGTVIAIVGAVGVGFSLWF